MEAATNTLVFFCERNPSLGIPGALWTTGDLLAAVRGRDPFLTDAEAAEEELFYSFRWQSEAIEVFLHRKSGGSWSG